MHFMLNCCIKSRTLLNFVLCEIRYIESSELLLLDKFLFNEEISSTKFIKLTYVCDFYMFDFQKINVNLIDWIGGVFSNPIERKAASFYLLILETHKSNTKKYKSATCL
jgi:hypothetical protein